MTLPISLKRPTRLWATNTAFATGPAVGSVTKSDPGSGLAAEGFIPGRAGAQHLNFLLNDTSTIQDSVVLEAKRNLAMRASKLRETSVNAYTDTGASIAAIRLTNAGNILVLKGGANDSKRIFDDDTLTTLGSIASVTSAVKGVAMNGSGRLVAIGTGGNRCAFSADSGVTWAAGSALPADGNAILFNANFGRYMVSSANGVSHDVDGASTWTTVVTGLVGGPTGGLAISSSGLRTLAPGLDGVGDLVFALSSDGGGSWAIAGGTCPNNTNYDDSGWITGNGGDYVYHVGRLNSGATLQVCRSTTGATWELLSTMVLTAAATARPKILMCPNTDVMWVIYEQSGGASTAIICSVDYGVNWSNPIFVSPRSVDAFACANGRLIATLGSRLQISDGVLR